MAALSGRPGLYQRASFDENTAATHANVITGVAGFKIRVVALAGHSASANTATIEYNGNDLYVYFGANATNVLVLPYNLSGWFEAPVAEGIDILLSGAVRTVFQFGYVLVEV